MASTVKHWPSALRQLLIGTAAVAGLLTVSSSLGLAQSSIKPILAEQTPLILKDGRIANVSVHVIPFEVGKDGLSDDVERDLDLAIAELATDCFLTAQAIGHVQPGDDAEGDTLTSHRLARARSDRILGELSAGGVPPASVASVWDWQFIIREPRVTLWVFQLRKGEDCEGIPLEAGAQVADSGDTGLGQASSAAVGGQLPELDAPPSEPNLAETQDPTESDALSEPVDVASLESDDVADETLAISQADEVAAAAETADDNGSDATSPGAITAPVAPAPVQLAVDDIDPVQSVEEYTSSGTPQPLDMSAITEPTPVTDTEIASIETPSTTTPIPTTQAALPEKIEAADDDTSPQAPDTPQIAEATDPQPAAAPQPVADTAEADATRKEFEITFAVNSSFLPRGASGELRDWMRLVEEGQYEAQLIASVGAGDVAGADKDEALKYNRWMAERRIGRVKEQLEKASGNRIIEMTDSFQENDASRKVVIQLRPVP